jgi:hypothetical protein
MNFLDLGPTAIIPKIGFSEGANFKLKSISSDIQVVAEIKL